MVNELVPGLIMIMAPISEIKIPIILLGPMPSPKNKKAQSVISTGFMSIIAVASARPISEIPIKKQLVAPISNTDLVAWSFG